MNATKPRAGAFTFLLQSIPCQAIAIALGVIIWPLAPHPGIALLVASSSAFGVSTLMRLPTPWRVLNALLPLGIAISLAWDLPQWAFLIPFVALACLYAPAALTRVPYYPTPRAAYSLILAELPTDRPFTFIDIGCGFGDLLLFLSKHRPNGRFVGIELGLLPWLMGCLRALLRGSGRVSIRFKNMWRERLNDYDVVYTFLSPAPMPQIWEKAIAEMKSGSLFITNSFPVPAPASEVVAVKDERCSQLFLHRMGR